MMIVFVSIAHPAGMFPPFSKLSDANINGELSYSWTGNGLYGNSQRGG